MPGFRIYADFNGLDRPAVTDGRWAVALDTVGTVRDLTNAGLRLVEGMAFTVWDASNDTEDLEGDAVARYDPSSGIWWADLGEASYRCVPAHHRGEDRRFLCLQCRRDLDGTEGLLGARAHAEPVCPRCGTPRSASIAPPAG